MKPDLTKIKRYTPAELAERRAVREGTIRKLPRKKGKRKNKNGTPMRNRKVVVATVSIRPELKSQAQELLGGGNFSKAVTEALTTALLDYYERARPRLRASRPV